MLGLTKKSYKIIGWCVIAISLLLAINYFIWDESFAGTSDSYIYPSDTFKNDSGKKDAEWNAESTLVLNKKNKGKSETSSIYRYNAEDGVQYDIYDIYLTVSGDKVTVHYKTGRGFDLNGIRLSYVMELNVFDNNGKSLNDKFNAYTTEWRKDKGDFLGEYDTETFDFKGDDWGTFDTPRSYINHKFHDAGITDNDSKSLKTLISEGRVEVKLKKIMIDDD